MPIKAVGAIQMTQQPDPKTEALAGLVERVTFINLESGFSVLCLKARGQRDLVIAVGHGAMISAGGTRIEAGRLAFIGLEDDGALWFDTDIPDGGATVCSHQRPGAGG